MEQIQRMVRILQTDPVPRPPMTENTFPNLLSRPSVAATAWGIAPGILYIFSWASSTMIMMIVFTE